MTRPPILRGPSLDAASRLLQSMSLPIADLTDDHLEHFFYCGSRDAPIGLIGLELFTQDGLLRSLAVVPDQRASGVGTALVARAEEHAGAAGIRELYLLTTTAEDFFRRRGYVAAERRTAPAAIRATREFAGLCPSSSAFLHKRLHE